MVSDLAATVVVAVIGAAAGVGGVTLGARLNRQNEKQAQADRLLVDALNETVDAISVVAHYTKGSPDEPRSDEPPHPKAEEGRLRYAAAMARMALYASPDVVAAFRRFQEIADTGTTEGRNRYVEAAAMARTDLDRGTAEPDDLRMLFFGSLKP
ncbi:MAG: hypothetical protein ABSC56_04970 [Solirubrobacteraceae bacterium]|jgi:hypothetical protein